MQALQERKQQRLPSLPSFLERALARLPAYPASLALALILNRLVRPLLSSEHLRPWYGKRFCIRVQDAGVSCFFSVDADGFSASDAALNADLSISASAYDFLLLATREEDPDTLFFSRRLLVEGDTDLGLQVKNALDAVDPHWRVRKLLCLVLRGIEGTQRGTRTRAR